MLLDISAYLGLFIAAFLAATLLPAQSEAVLAGLLIADNQQVWLLLLVASLGNTLGAAVNWLIGYHFQHLLKCKWFKIKPESLQRAQCWYHRYGRWSLLLSWMPIVGDPITLVAGILREPFRPVMAIVFVAKAIRYVIVAAIVLRGVGQVF